MSPSGMDHCAQWEGVQRRPYREIVAAAALLSMYAITWGHFVAIISALVSQWPVSAQYWHDASLSCGITIHITIHAWA